MNENNPRQNRQRPNGIRRPVNDMDFAKKRQNEDYENQIQHNVNDTGKGQINQRASGITGGPEN